MFDEFGAIDIGHQDGRHKGLINLLHEVDGAFALGSNYDAIRLHQIGYRAAFAQKFGITDHVEVRAMAVIPLDRFGHFFAGFHRHCALVDNHAVIGQDPRDFTSDFLQETKIDIAIRLLRSRNGDKDDLRILHALLYAAGET